MRVVEWGYKPGRPLPDPKIEDDREKLPPAVVVDVLQWLHSQVDRFGRPEAKPTDQIILGRTGGVRFLRAPTEETRGYEFESGTAEILLRETKTKVLMARFHYLVAHELKSGIRTGVTICGPQLKIEDPERRVILQ